jgi:hypothetical protein
MSTMFSPFKIGPYQLSHRVVMAPLTRMRSDPGDIPSDLMVEYYSQRASKGGADHFRGNARLDPWLWLCWCARHLFGPSD